MTAFAPDLETATELCARGQTALLTATRVDDLETPVSAYLKLASHNTNTFLLESVEGGAFRGRYSAIGLDPDLIWRCRGDVAEIATAPAPGVAPGAFEPSADKPLQSLRKLIDESRLTLPSGLPPIAAGLFGYLGYDTIRQVERLPVGDLEPLSPEVVGRVGVAAGRGGLRSAEGRIRRDGAV